MIRKHYRLWMLCGVLWGAAFYVFRYSVAGISFLMLCSSIAGFFAAFLGALYVPYQKKWAQQTVQVLKVITVVLVSLLLVSFCVVETLIWRGTKEDSPGEADCIIVLGAGVRGSTPSASLTARLDAALAYLQEHPDTAAILSGGQGRGRGYYRGGSHAPLSHPAWRGR